MAQVHPTQYGVTTFVTTNLQRYRRDFSDPACARIATETLYSIQEFYPVFLYGFVIMPNHCHILLRVPEGGSLSKFVGVYKRAVTFNIGRGPLWQARFHVRLPRNVYATLRYIHQNPVKAGLCAQSYDYPWSSACGRWDVQKLWEY